MHRLVLCILMCVLFSCRNNSDHVTTTNTLSATSLPFTSVNSKNRLAIGLVKLALKDSVYEDSTLLKKVGCKVLEPTFVNQTKDSILIVFDWKDDLCRVYSGSNFFYFSETSATKMISWEALFYYCKGVKRKIQFKDNAIRSSPSDTASIERIDCDQTHFCVMGIEGDFLRIVPDCKEHIGPCSNYNYYSTPLNYFKWLRWKRGNVILVDVLN